ncbi:MAG: twin-arginine translocase TatA/TatE family subunit [Phycisphaerales bacterium]|nr:twin-arginine translocase TatA/TatE family subunit [Phycisphaerales bacterium]
MATLAFIGNIGFAEWIIIAVVMLLIFGKRLPEVGRSIGKGLTEFKRGLADHTTELVGVKHQATQSLVSANGAMPQVAVSNPESHASANAARIAHINASHQRLPMPAGGQGVMQAYPATEDYFDQPTSAARSVAPS